MLDLVKTTHTRPASLGHFLSPIFDEKGLIPCIAQDMQSKQVLLLEWMDRRAYERTVDTGLAHYFINHRRGIWLRYPRPVGRYLVKEMLLNEEQNCLLLMVDADQDKKTPDAVNTSFHREFDWQD